MSAILKPALWLFACLFVLGLAGEARAERVDWSEYLEPKSARAKPIPLRETPRTVAAKETPAKKKLAAKKAKAGSKARNKRTKRPRRR